MIIVSFYEYISDLMYILYMEEITCFLKDFYISTILLNMEMSSFW